jgi:cytidylate kinase
MAIITITRGVQSGGREIARRLAERLGYKCMSREVISECARKYNIMEDDLYRRLMEAPSLWQRLSREHRRYLIYIQCSLVEAAKRDNVVYHGYAGHLFLKGVKHALKIRLDAPLETRIQAEMREYSKDRESAREYIERMDEERSRWVRFLYGKDWHDPSLYDLSISLHNVTIDTVCDMVERVVAGREFRTTTESVNGLNNLSLECEVQAAITSDENLWNQDITVSASGSTVALRGVVKNANTRDAIVGIASQVKGVTKCESYLGLLSDPLRGGLFGGNR